MINNMNRIASYHLLIAMMMCISFATADNAKDAREESKPFYLRDIEVGGTTLPFSPVTVVVMIISFIMLTGIFNTPKSTATASHILIEGTNAEERLNKMKKDIGTNYTKFQSLAKAHSICPSGKAAGGRLGTFKPGMM